MERFITQNLLDFIKPYYQNKDIMHDLTHVDRVKLYVNKILCNVNDEVDLEILTYSTYFHGFIYSDEQKIIDWLKSNQIAEDKIKKIIQASWESQKDEVAVSLEGKIIHDAHMIEGGKTYLIVKSLITGSVRGQSLEITIKYIEDHILDKGVCYLPEAQEIYNQMQNFAKNFINDLKEGLN